MTTELSRDPADFDGRLPDCEFCTDSTATKHTHVGGYLLCDECYQDWLMGRFDEDDPDDDQPHPGDHADDVIERQDAARIGCSQAYVSYVIRECADVIPPTYTRKNGQKVRRHPMRPEIQERREKVSQLLKEGNSFRDIARELGVAMSTIQHDIEVVKEKENLIRCPHCKGTGWMMSQ